jgi:hypothetical protein
MHLNAFHVYYLREPVTEKWEFINTLVQYASIVHWKKYYGPVHLYCNTLFYEEVKKNKLDRFYDSINVEVLDGLPADKLTKFWSFGKLMAIRDISEKWSNFVVLDTDLWFRDHVKLDLKSNLIGYHKEFISDHPRNPYVSPENFIDCKKYDFDWSVNPINCGFLYFNSQSLVQLWVSIAEEIVNNSNEVMINDISSDTIFIEQRLLAVIADKLKLQYETIIDNVYYPEVEINEEGHEWSPRIGHTEENLVITSKIKHVWGLKKRYHEPSIRELVLNVCLNSLDDNFPDWPDEVPDLVNKLWQLQKYGDLIS